MNQTREEKKQQVYDKIIENQTHNNVQCTLERSTGELFLSSIGSMGSLNKIVDDFLKYLTLVGRIKMIEVTGSMNSLRTILHGQHLNFFIEHGSMVSEIVHSQWSKTELWK